jgi:spore photoproduct lyase family protein
MMADQEEFSFEPRRRRSGAFELLNVSRIYFEPAVETFQRGREVLAQFPDAERIQVASHWKIPELHGNEGLAEDWLRVKRDTLVLGVKKGLTMRPNGRSADFIAPSTSNGCAMACAYCYVPRRKGYANPISVFVNIEEVARAIERHARRQLPKEPNQVDANRWVYDLGENGDLSVDALVSENVHDLVHLFRSLPNAKGSFATKFVNPDLLSYQPEGATRIRMSLMPAHIAKLVDVRTSPVEERIAFMNELVAAGYEVHVNFSPVIVYEGWESDWRHLFEQMDSTLTAATKQQLKAEVIFLTHNTQLHEVNLSWHPKAEDLLWRPNLQERKWSQNGDQNLRYRSASKRAYLAQFRTLLRDVLPSCKVRYAF